MPADRSLPAGNPVAAQRQPARGRTRLLRATVLAGCSLALAVGAHVGGGGTAPGPLGLVALSLCVFSVAVSATAIRLRMPVLIALLGGGQWLAHLALSALSAPAGSTPSLPEHHVMAVAMPASPAAMTEPMVAMHTVATLLTAWLLACGESFLWRVVARLLPARFATAGVPELRPVCPGIWLRARLHPRQATWSLPARGPPVGAFAG